MSAYKTITRAAYKNGWTFVVREGDGVHMERGPVTVVVHFNVRDAIKSASNGLVRVDTRTASKLQTVMAWLTQYSAPRPGIDVPAVDPSPVAPLPVAPSPLSVSELEEVQYRADHAACPDKAPVDPAKLELECARAELSAVIIRAARDTVARTGMAMAVSDVAPSTWEELSAVPFGTGGTLTVWSGASDHSVYVTAAANHAFRYFHDIGHIEHGLDFSVEDEYQLQTAHHVPELVAAYGLSGLALRLYQADTIGQIDHIVARGVFPDDQLGFCTEYVADPYRAVHVIDWSL